MASDYIILILFILIGVGFVVTTMWISWFFRPHKPKEAKLTIYECGELPYGEARLQFNFRYYIFALLFVAFDVETVFIYPWAVKFKDFIAKGIGWLAFLEMMIFLAILVVGLVYAWKKGVLEWQ